MTIPAPYRIGQLLADREQRWRRALADMDNLRKRQAQQRVAEQAAERARVAAAWLPVVDNLDLAMAHAGDDDTSAVLDGVRAVRDQAIEVLGELGYRRHDEDGVPFDPMRHEAVTVMTGTGAQPGTVLEVVRPGYGDGQDQLRPAAVAVAGDGEA